MNFKKVRLIFLAALLTLSMIGCSNVEGLLSDEEIYNDLASVIVSPSSSYHEDISGTIAFTAKVLGEPFEIEIEDAEGNFAIQNFITACISRKYNNYFLVDIGDIEYKSSINDIVTLSGKLDGSIYWTEDNSKVEKLLIRASAITPFEGEAVEPIESASVVVTNGSDSGEITFDKAYFTKDTFSNAYVLYFNFKNTGSTDTPPILDSLEIYQDDVMLSTGNFPVELDLDEGALKAGMLGEKTFAGKTDYYYYVLTPDGEGELDPTLPIEICKYDDDFNLTYYWQVESLADGAEEIAA